MVFNQGLLSRQNLMSMTTYSRPSKIPYGVICVALSVALIPNNAYAYLDPGTGSVVLQVLIAGILGAVFTFKSYVRAIAASITRFFRKTDNAPDA